MSLFSNIYYFFNLIFYDLKLKKLFAGKKGLSSKYMLF